MSLGNVTGMTGMYSTPLRPVGGKSSNMQDNPAFLQFKKEKYDEVYSHELAHKNAGGALAGEIVVDVDNNGVATGGHVNIAMPTLNKANPKETINHAEIVYKAAMAPHEPSDQDFKVAGLAMAARYKAEQALEQKGQQKMQVASNPMAMGQKLNFTA